MNKQEIDAAAKVHPVDYLLAKGEPLESTGHAYYKHKVHDSLVIHDSGNWFWNSRNVGGHGSITLAREFYNMKFQDAVREINKMGIEPLKNREKTFVKEEFRYPVEYEVKGIENAKRYLVEVRKLDPKIVDALDKHKLIAEDKKQNIVFKWVNSNGEIEGADRQGTIPTEGKRGYFKGIAANSKEDGGFGLDIGTPTKIAFFESPIDALSYFDLHRPSNIRLKSMSGLKDQVVMTSLKEILRECTERKEPVEKVIFGVDNDPAGHTFVEKWEPLIGEEMLSIEYSNEKDWNEELKKKRKFENTRTANKEFETLTMEGR